MRVPVVDVRRVRMPMNDRVVHMRVRVRLGPIPRERMFVPMVLVVPMRVLV